MIRSEERIVNDIHIRTGSQDDKVKIEEFAARFSENPQQSAQKWLRVIKQDNVLPLVAVYKDLIVGKIQARVNGKVGWLESAKVSPKYRNHGIGISLMVEATAWLTKQNVKYIRAAVESDNLPTRIILEKNGFKAYFLTISPSHWIVDVDTSPKDLSKFSYVLDESSYPLFENRIRPLLHGNVMIDGQYIPFNHELFEQLIQQKRIMVNGKKGSFLIISNHKMPEELHVFIVGEEFENYLDLGKAAIGLGSQESANFVICHAPCSRIATDGLISAGLGWEQPHSNIIYQKELK